MKDRPEDLVAMGERAFLLHYRTNATTALAVALGTSSRPICRELPDRERQCARILLLIIAPPRLAARYLQVVGAFARFLSSVERVDRVLAQPTAAAVAELPEFKDYELPEQLTVRDIMTDRPQVARVDAPLREAAQEMVRSRIGALPVVDAEDRLLGLLTEREIIPSCSPQHFSVECWEPRRGGREGQGEGRHPAPEGRHGWCGMS